MTDEVIYYRFLCRGGMAADLAAVNEIPLAREIVVEVDTGRMKLGDGVKRYNQLLYFGGGGVISVNARTGVVTLADFVEKDTAPVATDFGRPLVNGDRWGGPNGIIYTYRSGQWVTDNAASLGRYLSVTLRNRASMKIPINADGTIGARMRNGSATSIPLQA